MSVTIGSPGASRAGFRRPVDPRFQMFGVLFALGTIHHELQFLLNHQQIGPLETYMERWRQVRPATDWSSEIGLTLHLGTMLVALLTLALPWRQWLLTLMALPFFLSMLASPDRISSHSSLMAAALALILALSTLELAERMGRRTSGEDLSTDWGGWLVMGLVWLCVLTYVFAAFHKVNPLWFSPTRSSALDFVLPYVKRLGLEPDDVMPIVAYPVTYGVVILEAIIPLLLLWRRTRIVGCLLGLLLHLPMLGQGIMDFPTLILAFYPLFLSVEQARELLYGLVARPSVARLACTAALWAAAAATMPLPSLENGATMVGQVLVGVSTGLAYATLLLFVYLTVTMCSALIRPGWQRVPVSAPA